MSLGSQLDLIATFAELANAKLPNKTLDSYSLVPTLLENKQSKRERERNRERQKRQRERQRETEETQRETERGERKG